MVLMRLFQTSRRFQVEIQPQLVLLQKTLLNIEGLGRQLDPDLDLWSTAKPFLERWMLDQVGPQKLMEELRDQAPRYAKLLPELPRLLHDYLQQRPDDGTARTRVRPAAGGTAPHQPAAADHRLRHRFCWGCSPSAWGAQLRTGCGSSAAGDGIIRRHVRAGGLAGEPHADHVRRPVPAGHPGHRPAWAGTRIKNTSDFAIAGPQPAAGDGGHDHLRHLVRRRDGDGHSGQVRAGRPERHRRRPVRRRHLPDPGRRLFFAAKLYKQNLLTIGDFYRARYGRGVEVFCSCAIILSYLGWVAAQITALGLVFSVLTNGAMSETAGMIVGTLAVLVYVVIGGFLAVAWTDFIQMIVLVVGLSVIACSPATWPAAPTRWSPGRSKDLWALLARRPPSPTSRSSSAPASP
jgi:hypothetical protein